MNGRIAVALGVGALVAAGVGVAIWRSRPADVAAPQPAQQKAPEVVGPRADFHTGDAAAPVRLSLQHFNGCALLPSGEPAAKGNAAIPYPEKCIRIEDPWLGFGGPPEPERVAPTQPIPLVAGTRYLLHELTLMEKAPNLHRRKDGPDAPSKWMATQSIFKGLDWSGVRIVKDKWQPINEALFQHEVFFGDAAWMKNEADHFMVEVLDAAGKVQRSVKYDREDFWASSPVAGHSRFSWLEFPVPAPSPSGVQPASAGGPEPALATTARLELAGALKEEKAFTLPELTGDGAIRVTWSQLADQPFYFPVRFVAPKDVPATCYSGVGDNERVPCGFGLKPKVELSAPANGRHFVGGEEVELRFVLEDDAGNRLHPRDAFPSYRAHNADQANGVMYFTLGRIFAFWDRDFFTSFKVMGPRHLLTAVGDVRKEQAYFQYPAQLRGAHSTGEMIDPWGVTLPAPVLSDVEWPARYWFKLPENPPPGTYVIVFRGNRAWMGERLAKTASVTFQVGQDAVTDYPGDVGGCESCHKDGSNLTNLLHGFEAKDIPTCKGCHANVDQNLAPRVHAIHFDSPKFPRSKGDCAVCHLQKASAVRSSFEVCGGCHENLHKGELKKVELSIAGNESRFDSCAVACHDEKPPAGHVLATQ